MNVLCKKSFYYSGSAETNPQHFVEGQTYTLSDKTVKHLKELGLDSCFEWPKAAPKKVKEDKEEKEEKK